MRTSVALPSDAGRQSLSKAALIASSSARIWPINLRQVRIRIAGVVVADSLSEFIGSAGDGAHIESVSSRVPGATHRAYLRPFGRVGLRLILFPWLLWSAAGLLPRLLRRKSGSRRSIHLTAVFLHTAVYAGIGLPLTLVGIGEVLISVNEWVIGEQADYGLQSDFEAGTEDLRFDLPGSSATSPATAMPSSGAPWRQHLVELYSPVIVQKVANHPEWDLPVALDFDGNTDPRDNVENLRHGEQPPSVVYGELTAETDDSYYLLYSLYRVKDYDHPLRELVTDWTFHDNDNEGLMLRVEKASMRVVQVETWFHNRFLLYALDSRSAGSEPVSGAIHTENGTHPIVYGQSQGHGVRLFQTVDLGALDRNVKILRWRGDRAKVYARADRSRQIDVTYDLRDFDAWYAEARSFTPSGTAGTGLFEGVISLGRFANGEEIRIGRYIAGRDYSKVGWSRPKPPWSWDDGWDHVPIWSWHFLPHHAFAMHSGVRLSPHYLYNHPMQQTFDMRPEEIYPFLHVEMARRDDDKWATLEERGGRLPHRSYWQALEFLAKSYVNYLFRSLG